MSEYLLSPDEHDIRTLEPLDVKAKARETFSQRNKRLIAKAAGRSFVVVGDGLRAGSLVLSPDEVLEVRLSLSKAHARLREELTNGQFR